eukprot:207099-Hanusia_phi.AAC.9
MRWGASNKEQQARGREEGRSRSKTKMRTRTTIRTRLPALLIVFMAEIFISISSFQHSSSVIFPSTTKYAAPGNLLLAPRLRGGKTMCDEDDLEIESELDGPHSSQSSSASDSDAAGELEVEDDEQAEERERPLHGDLLCVDIEYWVEGKLVFDTSDAIQFCSPKQEPGSVSRLTYQQVTEVPVQCIYPYGGDIAYAEDFRDFEAIPGLLSYYCGEGSDCIPPPLDAAIQTMSIGESRRMPIDAMFDCNGFKGLARELGVDKRATVDVVSSCVKEVRSLFDCRMLEECDTRRKECFGCQSRWVSPSEVSSADSPQNAEIEECGNLQSSYNAEVQLSNCFHGSLQLYNISHVSKEDFDKHSLSDPNMSYHQAQWFRMKSDGLPTALQDAIVKHSIAGSPVTVFVRSEETNSDESLSSSSMGRNGTTFKSAMYQVYNITVLEWNEYRKLTADGGIILCLKDCRKSFAHILRHSDDADFMSLDLHCRVVAEADNDFVRGKLTSWRNFENCNGNVSQDGYNFSVSKELRWTAGHEWNDCNLKLVLGDFEFPSGLERCLQQLYVGQQCKAWMRAPYLNTFRWKEENVRGEGETFGPSAEALYEFEWKVLNITPKFMHPNDHKLILAKRRKALGNQLLELQQFQDAKEVYFRALDILGDMRVDDTEEVASDSPEPNDSTIVLGKLDPPAHELEISCKINLATAYIQLKEYDRAISLLDPIILSEPWLSRAYQRRMIAAIRSGDIESFERILKLLEAVVNEREKSTDGQKYQESNPVSRNELDKLKNMLKEAKSDVDQEEKTLFSKMFQKQKRVANDMQKSKTGTVQEKSISSLKMKNPPELRERKSSEQSKVTKLSIEGFESPHIVVRKEVGQEEQRKIREEMAQNASTKYNRTVESGVKMLRDERIEEERANLRRSGRHEKLNKDMRFTPHSVTDSPQEFPSDMQSILNSNMNFSQIQDESKIEHGDTGNAFPRDPFLYSNMLQSSRKQLEAMKLENLQVKRSILEHLLHTVKSIKRTGGGFNTVISTELEILKRQLMELEDETERDLVETSEAIHRIKSGPNSTSMQRRDLLDTLQAAYQAQRQKVTICSEMVARILQLQDRHVDLDQFEHEILLEDTILSENGMQESAEAPFVEILEEKQAGHNEVIAQDKRSRMDRAHSNFMQTKDLGYIDEVGKIFEDQEILKESRSSMHTICPGHVEDPDDDEVVCPNCKLVGKRRDQIQVDKDNVAVAGAPLLNDEEARKFMSIVRNDTRHSA